MLQVFNSHCAPEPVANMQPEQLTVSELKGRLKDLNLPLNGRKVRCTGPALQRGHFEQPRLNRALEPFPIKRLQECASGLMDSYILQRMHLWL